MLQDIRELLKGTFLEDAMMMELEIPRTTDIAIAIDVKSENAIEAWKLLKSHIDQTQRYPVLTTCWCRNYKTWEQGMIDQDIFSRCYFDEEYPEELSPETIIANTDLYTDDNLEQFLRFREDESTYDLEVLEERLIYRLERIKAKFGTAPSISEIKDAAIHTNVDLERYLFNWEQKQNLHPSLDLHYQNWYEPEEDKVLILLPNPYSWNVLAYMPWYGDCKNAVPLMKQWHQNYGAELVSHYEYGTILQFFVERRPTELQEAFDLALQQVAIAQCTIYLPGVSIRDHARALLELDHWKLREKP